MIKMDKLNWRYHLLSVQDVLDDDDILFARRQFIDDVRNADSDEKIKLLQRPTHYIPKSYETCVVAATAEYLADEAGISLDWCDDGDFKLDEETYPKWLTMSAYRDWVKQNVDPIFHKHNVMCDKSAMTRV